MPIATMTARRGTTVSLTTGSKRRNYTVKSVANGKVELELKQGYGTGIDYVSHYSIADFERRTGFKLDESLLEPTQTN